MKTQDMVVLKFMKVTPEKAAEWVEKNITIDVAEHGNRNIKEWRVAYYKDLMRRGEWNECNGETIKFDASGNLIDGQHRLRAQIELGLSLWYSVAFNCSHRAFVTIDCGGVRTGSDALTMVGEKNANIAAGALGLYHKYKSGNMDGNNTPSNAQLTAMIGECDHVAFRHAIGMAVNNRAAKGIMPPSMAAFLHYVGSQTQGQEKADHFLVGVCTGEGTTNGAILKLRNKLVENAMASKKAPRVAVLAWCIKAWNAFVGGRAISSTALRYKSKATRNQAGEVTCPIEDFPRIL
jgi:hypothetical protein